MEVLTVGPEEAAKALNIGRTAVYALLASGELPSFVVGRRRLIPVAALRAWVDRKSQEAQPA